MSTSTTRKVTSTSSTRKATVSGASSVSPSAVKRAPTFGKFVAKTKADVADMFIASGKVTSDTFGALRDEYNRSNVKDAAGCKLFFEEMDRIYMERNDCKSINACIGSGTYKTAKSALVKAAAAGIDVGEKGKTALEKEAKAAARKAKEAMSPEETALAASDSAIEHVAKACKLLGTPMDAKVRATIVAQMVRDLQAVH